MDFSAWDWANYFRLHEAACLIAGVMPVSRKLATSEELPPQARPVFVALGSAYYEWLLQAKNPDRPRTIVLEGLLNDDGTLPEFPVVKVLSGELVGRAALHSYIAATGRKSIYDFRQIELTPSEMVISKRGETDAQPQGASTSQGTQSKLSEAEKSEIVRLFNRGHGTSVNALSKQFGVSRPRIDVVLKRAGIKK